VPLKITALLKARYQQERKNSLMLWGTQKTQES